MTAGSVAGRRAPAAADATSGAHQGAPKQPKLMNVSDNSHIPGVRAPDWPWAHWHMGTQRVAGERPLIDHECPPGRRD